VRCKVPCYALSPDGLMAAVTMAEM
jgi:hypothetical protein